MLLIDGHRAAYIARRGPRLVKERESTSYMRLPTATATWVVTRLQKGDEPTKRRKTKR